MPPQTSVAEAMSLDIHVLSILLQRNRHQHHRCIYYRRLAMALQALRKASPSLEGFGGWKVELEALSKSIESTKGRKRTQKEEHWTIEQLGQDSGSIEPDATSQLQVVSEKLQKMVLEMIPRISSRIQHAASAVFYELSRIHFVPFLTVAIACMGRIHSILLQMGREAVTCLTENKVNFDGNINHLFEVSHDELVNKMNGLMDELRWRDAVRKFKLGKGFVKSRNAKVEEGTRNTSGVQDKSNNSFVEEYIGMNDDTGEIVSAASKCFDQGDGTVGDVKNNNSTEGTYQRQASKTQKVNLDHTVPSASEKPKKKKKKKRKEKKKRRSELGIDDNIDGEEKEESSISQQDDADAAKEEQTRISHDETVNDRDVCKGQQGSSSLPNLEVDSIKKKRKNKKKRKGDDMDSIFNDEFGGNEKHNSSTSQPEPAGSDMSRATKAKRFCY